MAPWMTLRNVAEITRRGTRFGLAIRAFFQSFAENADTRDGMRRAVMGRPKPTGNPMHDAYLAGVAEGLALRYGFEPPRWVEGGDRFLQDPWFAEETEDFRNILLAESPAAFRRRNIFVDAGVLDHVEKARIAAGKPARARGALAEYAR